MNASIAIVLCADDYAQHVGVDQAVLGLLAQQRLSAVSCMSNAPRWRQHAAPALRERRAAHFDIGLHFNLTEGYGAPPAHRLAPLLLQSHLRSLNLRRLRDEWQRQLDAFEAAMEQSPDFIDGHQHVHQLPQIRDALLQLLAQRYPQPQSAPWVRNTVAVNQAWGGKSRLLQRLGGNALARQLRGNHIASNGGFAGVYGFDQADYAACFDHWLRSARNGTLLMCHPGMALDEHDPISAQRLVEFAFFDSPAFPRLLAQRGARLARLRDC